MIQLPTTSTTKYLDFEFVPGAPAHDITSHASFSTHVRVRRPYHFAARPAQALLVDPARFLPPDWLPAPFGSTRTHLPAAHTHLIRTSARAKLPGCAYCAAASANHAPALQRRRMRRSRRPPIKTLPAMLSKRRGQQPIKAEVQSV